MCRSMVLLPMTCSVIIGAQAYLPIAEKYQVPCVIAGFEPVDVLQSIAMLVEQIERSRGEVEIAL